MNNLGTILTKSPIALGVKAQGFRLWKMRWTTTTLVLLVGYAFVPISIEVPSFLFVDLLSGKKVPSNGMVAIIWMATLWLLICIVLSWLDAVRIAGTGLLKSLGQSTMVQLKGRRPLLFALALLVSIVAFVIAHGAMYALHPLAPNLVLALLIGGPFLLLRPPVALFLAASGTSGHQVSDVASSALYPLRGVMLLEANMTKLPLHMFGEDNIRQISSENWEVNVQELMDLVALIVIDGRSNSSVVSKELQWIISSSHRAANTVLVTNDDGSFNLSLGYRDAKNISRVTQCSLSALPFGIWRVLDKSWR